MNPSDIKSLQTFQKAIRPWQKKHRASAGLTLNNDFKLVKETTRTALILDSGNTPGSFFASCVNKKYLRTILYFVEKGKLVKATENYKARRKGLDALLENISSVDWDKGTFHGAQCLYCNDPYIFSEVFSKTTGASEQELIKILKDAYDRANDEYNNSEDGVSFLSDAEFDSLEALLRQKKALGQTKEAVGAPVSTERKVKLPNVMPSLEYEKTPDKIKAWAKKQGLKGFLATPKIDGISLQLIYKKGRLFQAFTRGDGQEAEDKTTTAKAIPGIPQILTRLVDLECRVEAYMENETFKKKYSKESGGKYSFSNPRACVAGMFNRKIPEKEILKDVKVLAFEAFKGGIPNAQTKSQMLNGLALLGLPVVPSSYISLDDVDKLPAKLSAQRARSPVSMDGLVLEVDDLKKREQLGNETNSINPAWAKAFKPNADEVGTTTVKSIRWKLSNTGYIKPTAMLEPVDIKGVSVTKANCFNAAYIRDNDLGPGSTIEIQRSGDAIPHIVRVVKSTKPDYSGAAQFGKYSWSETKVDFILDKGETGDELVVQQLIRFFESVGAEYFSEGTIRRLAKAGYNTVPGILRINDKQLGELGGFKEKAIQRTRTVFGKLRSPGITLPTYMYASGAFGRGLGKDKLIKIFEVFGDDCVTGWDGQSLRDIASSIETIHGFSFETGVQYAKGLKPFMKFAKECGDLISIIRPKQASGSKLKGTIALLTGFRDQAIQDFIIDQGGRIASSMNKSVTLLIIKDKATNNDKTAKAQTMGTKVLTQAEFKSKYTGGV